jgi:predicted DNA-binding protein with PD1-like motif
MFAHRGLTRTQTTNTAQLLKNVHQRIPHHWHPKSQEGVIPGRLRKTPSFKAIGALSEVELGRFNRETKNYQTAVKLHEQVELLSLIGDIALKVGEPQVHAHLLIGRQDESAHGGHLLSATVRPTCEIVITESPKRLQKEIDPESGIALIHL